MRSYLIALISLTFTFVSCKNELSVLTSLKGKSKISYQESIEKWNSLKKANGNSYIYQTTVESWAGFGSTTELKVVDGKVVSRMHQDFNIDDKSGKRETTNSYTENENKVGSHKDGAPPLTIDELYTSCAGKYLVVEAEENMLYFNTDEKGLMTTCGFVPNNCADDCFEGISIDSFQWID